MNILKTIKRLEELEKEVNWDTVIFKKRGGLGDAYHLVIETNAALPDLLSCLKELFSILEGFPPAPRSRFERFMKKWCGEKRCEHRWVGDLHDTAGFCYKCGEDKE